jgi:uncharacterized membrane protein YozB (DUF420 family)
MTSHTLPSDPGRLGRGERNAGFALWLLFALSCALYALLAVDYFVAFASGREGLWTQLFASLVGRDHALGAGSVHLTQRAPYQAGLNLLLMHTITGAVALFLGPFQFVAAFRQRFPSVHRQAGKVYLISVGLSMVGGLGYLFTTPLTAVYSGAPFAIALIGLDFMVLITGGLAYIAIRRREIDRHRAWIAVNFGLILATPVLRLLWILFAWALPHWNQAEANLAIMTFLLPLCVVGILWFTPAPALRIGVPPVVRS